MAKCNCTGTTCGCKIIGSASVNIYGTGTAQDPYKVEVEKLPLDGLLNVRDSNSIDFTLTGNGTVLEPFALTAVIKESAIAAMINSPSSLVRASVIALIQEYAEPIDPEDPEDPTDPDPEEPAPPEWTLTADTGTPGLYTFTGFTEQPVGSGLYIAEHLYEDVNNPGLYLNPEDLIVMD